MIANDTLRTQPQAKEALLRTSFLFLFLFLQMRGIWKEAASSDLPDKTAILRVFYRSVKGLYAPGRSFLTEL